jgi:hypothetical protein
LHFVVSGSSFLASGSERLAGRLRFVAKALDLDVAQRYVAALINDRPENCIRRLVVHAPPTFEVVACNRFDLAFCVLDALEAEHLVDDAIESEKQVADLSGISYETSALLENVLVLLLVVFGELLN